MRTLALPEIRAALNDSEIIDRMRDAVVAYSRGECEMPLPMHLDIAPNNEVHIKSSYRRGGRHFALKIAGTFPGNPARGLPTGNGMMLLSSAETGAPEVFLADAGHLTDVRTAAVAAMAARELRRTDTSIGILGTGIQARLQARFHAEVLGLQQVWLWGRNSERVAQCIDDILTMLPNVEVILAVSPASLARQTQLIVTTTASRDPLLRAEDIRPGTHISAVGADSTGKQELDPEILRRAALLLADSLPQCEKFGELQHAPEARDRAMELGSFCLRRSTWDRGGITVCDFTGLGAEDLYIAEYIYERAS
jgi:ornithine cyclodeaminase